MNHSTNQESHRSTTRTIEHLERDDLLIARGDEVEIRPIRWLWPGILAIGKLHLLAGEPGVGKTTVAMSLLAAITNGGPMPDGHQVEAGNVVVWSDEDDPDDTLMPRLKAMGADAKRCYFIKGARSLTKERGFNPARDLPLLRDAVSNIGNVKIVLFDPIVSFVCRDSNSNVEVRKALAPLGELASDLGVAILGITHFRKGKIEGEASLSRVNGSVAFGAVPRVVLVVARIQTSDDDAELRLVRCKSNLGPAGDGFAFEVAGHSLEVGLETNKVVWTRPLFGTEFELLNTAGKSKEHVPKQLDTAAAFLTRTLRRGPVGAKELEIAAKSEGISQSSLRRAKEQMKVNSFKTSDRWVWSLSQGSQGGQGAQGDQAPEARSSSDRFEH